MTSITQSAMFAPRRTLAVWAVVVSLMIPGLFRLRLDTDGRTLAPQDDAVVRVDRQVRRQFDVHDQLVVAVHTDDPNGIYNGRTLDSVRALSERIAAIHSLDEGGVRSLATEKSERLAPDAIRFLSWLDPMPNTALELEDLRTRIEALRIYDGTLISKERPARSTVILVDAPSDGDRVALYREITRVVTDAELAPDTVSIVGAPVAESLLGEHLLEDMQRLIPLSLLLMSVVFWLTFRSAGGVLLPLMEIGACLLFVFGGMGWVGVPVYLTVVIVPVILTAIGVADEVHLLTRYARCSSSESGRSRAAAVTETMNEMATPIVWTSVTTCAAFLSFALSPIQPVRVFGLALAAGITFCCLWSLTAVPALLVLLPDRFLARSRKSFGSRRMDRLSRVVTSPGSRVVAACLLLFSVGGVGILKLEIQDSWLSGFSEESRLRRETTRLDREFAGTHLLHVAFDTADRTRTGGLSRPQLTKQGVTLPFTFDGVPSRLLGQRLSLAPRDGSVRPANIAPFERHITAVERLDGSTRLEFDSRGPAFEVWNFGDAHELTYMLSADERVLQDSVFRKLEAFEQFLATAELASVGAVLGPVELISATHFQNSEQAPEQWRAPDSAEERQRTLWRYKLSQGTRRLHQTFSTDNSSALVTLFLREANYKATKKLFQAIREYELQELAPFGIKLRLAGDVAISQATIDSTIRTQRTSLAVSLVAIVLAASVLFRSVQWGVLCSLPTALSVLLVFGLMGWFGVPLGVATSMFAATVLGIGVDHAIHLCVRIRKSHQPSTSHRDAVAVTAPALLIDAGAIAAAFGLLGFSAVPTNARLGALVAIGVLASLAATLALLPTLAKRFLAAGARSERRP